MGKEIKTPGGEPLRIVSIGGGTGLSTLLRGLKLFAPGQLDIVAVVTVTDDGGSSGRLRRDFDILPPGDIRNCMVALSEDETLMSRLFQYRFASGRGLKGHSFGNLFLTAMCDLTGDFAHAVKLSSEVLASAGHIYPVTSANVALEAVLSNGRIVFGESRISRSRSRIERIRLKPSRCKPLPEVLEAIAAADLITLGPGSLYTSIVPNLLVSGVADAIVKARAAKAYFVNLMWQPGETIGFPASAHVQAIHDHAGRPFLDVAIVNTRKIRPGVLRKYAAQRSEPVENDNDQLRKMGLRVVSRALALEDNVVRHDPGAVAAVAMELAAESRAGRRQ